MPEPRKLVSEEILLFNGYQPNNVLFRSGVVTEERGNVIDWSVESESCIARWTDGRTVYGVRLNKEGRWEWSVTEFALDPEDDWSRERSGVEDSYAAARGHLSTNITNPDHAEIISFSVYRDPLDEPEDDATGLTGDQGDFDNIPF